MKKQHKASEEARKTMGILNDLGRATANPYLLQKIEAKLEGNQRPERQTISLVWSGIAAALLIGNIFMWMTSWEADDTEWYEVISEAYVPYHPEGVSENTWNLELENWD